MDVLKYVGNIVLKLLDLLRPKFYNKLAWVIVSAGLTMMATPLIERLISVLIKSSFQIDFTNGNDVAWGFALVVSGLLYHLATTSIFELVSRQDRENIGKERIEHDRNIYKKANEIMSAEFLYDKLDVMWGDHSYYMSDVRKIEAFQRYLAMDENQFLVEGVAERVDTYRKASKALMEFSAVRFFMFPNKQTGGNHRLCMQPGLNVDREGHGTPEQMRRYDELSTELHGLIKTLESEYKLLRAEVKSKLII